MFTALHAILQQTPFHHYYNNSNNNHKDHKNNTASAAVASAAVGTLDPTSNLMRYPIDILVNDIMTSSGTDIAHYFDIPLVLNNADLLYVLSPRTLPPTDAVPMMFRDPHSLHSLGSGYAALVERVVGPPLRLLVSALVTARFGASLNQARATASPALTVPVDLLRAQTGVMVIQNTAWGLESPR